MASFYNIRVDYATSLIQEAVPVEAASEELTISGRHDE
jgi:hypothetical protein